LFDFETCESFKDIKRNASEFLIHILQS